MDDRYPDKYAKMALAITSTQVAKQNIVDQFGIGEDLPFMFMGWHGDTLAVMLGFGQEDMRLPVPERLPKVSMACNVMRVLYWVDSITFVAEGFMSKEPFQLKGRELSKAFADNDTGKVSECLTTSHVWINRKDQPEAMLMSTPYTYVVGRHIVWGENSAYSSGIGRVLRDAPLLAVVAQHLPEPTEYATQEEYDEACALLMHHGLSIQEFVDPPCVN